MINEMIKNENNGQEYATPSINTNLQKNQKQDSTFTWLPCEFVLREKIQQDFMYRSLKPTMELVCSKTDKQACGIQLKVEMDRPFEYNDETGWAWHKSWNIPTIRVSAEFPNSPRNKILPENCSFIMRVVKASSKNLEKLFMIDVGTKGPNVISAYNGSAVFQGIKFLQTSYKNQNAKFSLVLILRIFEPGHVHPQIICSVISSPIFIDSRKGVSGNTSNVAKNIFQEYNPLRLQQIFIKRKKELERAITNSAQGLLNYITAPNIRNKVKNPFFLYSRFYKVLRMFYNTREVENKNDLISTYMKRINKVLMQDKLKSKKERKFNQQITENTLIVFLLEGSEQIVTEIISKLQPSFSSLVYLSPYLEKLPENFSIILKDQIKTQYEEFYRQAEFEEHQKSEVETQRQELKPQYLMIRPINSFTPVKNTMFGQCNFSEASYRLASKLISPVQTRQIQIISTVIEDDNKNGHLIKKDSNNTHKK